MLVEGPSGPGQNTVREPHISEDLLEAYCLGHIIEPQLARLEEHLLICPACICRLEQLDEYHSAMKAALAEMAEQSIEPPIVAAATERLPRAAWWRPALWVSSGSFGARAIAAAAVLVMIATGTAAIRNRMYQTAFAALPPAQVQLVALRGGKADAGVAQGPAGQPVVLRIDRRTLPEGASFRLELVDTSGRELWSAVPRESDEELVSRCAQKLEPGRYWVRLYSAPAEAGVPGDSDRTQPQREKLIREFGLQLE